ncbi:MAG TPA: L,D-transpeptidase family protein [Solirubrobacteraceae bacterium]|nr:L,D-transpeptidase family protein [Solirubrobacteraceae bacterium]
MSRRALVICCALVLAPVFAAAPAGATPPLPGERIAPAITAGGVDVSGLTIEEAAQRLSGAFGPRLAQNVIVQRADMTFRLTAKGAKVRFDTLTTAKRALYAGRDRPAPAVPGAPPAAIDVPLAVRHDQAVVRRFAARVRGRLHRPARDSQLRIGVRSVRVTHSKRGRTINAAALARRVGAALDDPRLTRVFRPALIRLRPGVNANQLRRRANTVITIQQSTFTLRLFKGLRVVKTYRVAVGQPSYPTPRGLFSIASKQVNPTWSVPNSPWAGELAGTTVVGGSAANPLRARWMGIVNGVGIHGTNQSGSIGTRASHGCIRMHVPDVIALYRRVPIGTPVLIR